jgi:uncharacterized protein
MTFVDSSAWFAAVNRRDRHHPRAIELLASHAPLVTSDLVVVETWLLTNSRIDFVTAERFFRVVSDGSCEIVHISEDDWRQSSTIASRFIDQTFSIVDRTSFAVMERLGITQAISFDDDFVIYRYGQDRMRAFGVFR